MSEKNDTETKGKKVDLDLEAFGKQIDSEIDKLFVPISISSQPEAEEPFLSGMEDKMPGGVSPKAAAPPAVSSVPSMERPPAPPMPEVVEIPAIEMAVVEESPRMSPELVLPKVSKDKGLPDVPTFAEAVPAPVHKTAPPKVEPEPDVVPPEAMGELPALLESFHVAYLSLEWEFSAENLTNLDLSLGKLEPYCRKSQESISLFKILKAILQRSKTRPSSASSQLTELIRDSRNLLATLLAAGGRAKSNEREELKGLIARFHALREKGPALKSGRAEPQVAPPIPTPPAAPFAEEASSPVAVPHEAPAPSIAVASVSPVPEIMRKEAPPVAFSMERIGAFDLQAFRELREWMESYRSRSGEALARIEEESKRILQVEEVLAKAPALVSIRARMTNIRTNMGNGIGSFREREKEWEVRIESLRAMEKNMEAQAAAQVAQPVLADVQELVVTPPELGISPVPLEFIEEVSEADFHEAPTEFLGDVFKEPLHREVSGRPAPEKPSSEVTKETVEMQSAQVCLFDLPGKRLAILTSHVVKIEQISSKKLNKILNRGYATLSDFKPFFKSLKTGLFGAWSGLPADVLKSYQFLPIPHELFHIHEESPVRGGIILVSNGQYHGMIITESSGVQLHNETILKGGGEENILGVIRTGSNPPVEVINVDHTLKKLYLG